MRIAAALLIASMIILKPVEAQDEKTPGPLPTNIIYTAAKEFRPLAWARGEERFPRGAELVIRDGQRTRALAPSFAASADANLSFDAQRVVFAGKPKNKDHWQIWELDLQTQKLRLVRATAEDMIHPMYLPDDRVVYAKKQGGRFILESAGLDGKNPLILYYLPGNAVPSDVLRDGRILFEAGYPLGNGNQPELYTVYADGSGVESYRCDHGAPRYAGKQLGSGDIVFTHGVSLARFTSAKAEEVRIDTPAGEYAGDVVETATGEWIFPYRPRTGVPFSLFSRTPNENAPQRFVEATGTNYLQPVLVAVRPTPNRHPSALHEWKSANLLALNSHISHGENIPGNIALVRVYTRNEKGKAIELGTSPVEKDGSFYVSVPGDRPIQFELVDDAGKTIRHEAGWMWARAGEQRICVGCHAGPETAPENAVPQVLLRSIKPADLASSHETTKQGGR